MRYLEPPHGPDERKDVMYDDASCHIVVAHDDRYDTQWYVMPYLQGKPVPQGTT